MGYIQVEGVWRKKGEEFVAEENVEAEAGEAAEMEAGTDPSDLPDIRDFEFSAGPSTAPPPIFTAPPPPSIDHNFLTGLFNQFTESITSHINSCMDKVEGKISEMQVQIDSLASIVMNSKSSEATGSPAEIVSKLTQFENYLEDNLKLFQSRIVRLEEISGRHIGYQSDLILLRDDFSKMTAAARDLVASLRLDVHKFDDQFSTFQDNQVITWEFLQKLCKVLSDQRKLLVRAAFPTAAGQAQPPPKDVSPPPPNPFKKSGSTKANPSRSKAKIVDDSDSSDSE